MIVLLSPAKNLDYESQVVVDNHSQPRLLENADYLINKLRKLSARQISNLMKLSPALADLNYERYQRFSTPFSIENARQAVYAFNGEVYNGLDASTLSEEDLAYAQNNLRILSGLYGLLKPLDLMQAYRLEMGTKFAVTKTKKDLYHYWNTSITDLINQDLEESNSDCLINLASNEYFKAVKPSIISKKIITPIFKEEKEGEFKVVMVYAKKARGMMARFIIQNRLSASEDIKGFDVENYAFNSHLSSANEWVFTR